jgi:5-methylcytosine-specific restriction enzyme A
MPMKPPRICSCGNLIASNVICICQQRRNAEADKRRPTAHARGYDSKWKRESKAFLAQPQNHLCACGCGRVANMVDHIIPHRGDMKLFWSRSNWQPMAMSPCHTSRKQSIERRTNNRINQ